MKKVFRVVKKSLLISICAFFVVVIFAYLLETGFWDFFKQSKLLIGLSIFLLVNIIVCLILWPGED